jgi:hypothetical protein
MLKREYKLAAAFFFILGISTIFFSVDRFMDERALRKEHTISMWALTVGLLGVSPATAISVRA